MLPHEIDPESGARMVGGEIPNWSEPVSEPSPCLAELVDSAARELAPGARVLLAGMPAVSLRGQLPDGLDVDLLVRGLEDARALDSRQPTRRGDVVVGAVDRLARTAQPYDLVVALGGADTTCAPDSEVSDSLQWLQLVLGLAGPGGRVVASVANPNGLDRLVTLGPADEPARWATAGGATAVMTSDLLEGLGEVQVLGAYPSLTSPSVLLTREDLVDGSGPAQAAVAALAAHAFDRPVAQDVWDRTQALLDAGLGLALAPAWVVTTISPSRPAPLPHPRGALLLETRLRRAVAGNSHAQVRELVRTLAAWPDGPADPRDVLVLPDGSLARVGAPGVEGAGAASLPTVLADFAQRVCADGSASLWESPTPDLVLRDLLAMAGREDADGAGALVGRPAPTSRAAEVRRLRAAESALDETRRQVVWLEGTVRAKDRRIRTLERAIAIERSTAYKVVHQLARPVPALKRRVRGLLDRRSAR